MKKGVVIVNTARGAVMDEAALVRALENGQVASVGLDVYENEPEVHEGLVNNPHVMLVPHLGTYTVEVSRLSLLLFVSSRLPSSFHVQKEDCSAPFAVHSRSTMFDADVCVMGARRGPYMRLSMETQKHWSE